MAANGYKDLLKAWREKTPEILHFTAERLWEAQRIEDYERLERAMYSTTPIPQLLRLALVFDENIRLESVLETVATAIEKDAPPNASFMCYLITRTDLRALVNDSFDKMAELAEQT